MNRSKTMTEESYLEMIEAKVAKKVNEKESPAGGPACWDGKKIGNPKTKMKGGKRVNNCVPEGAEDRARYDADETPRGEKKKKVSLKKAPWDKDDEEVKTKEEIELEQGFEEMMGQFAEGDMKWKQTSMSPEEAVAKYGKDNVKVKKGGLNNGDDMVSVQVADESFDPQSEPSDRDLAVEDMMNAYEKGGEKALAAYMHISEEELDQDINEWCAEHGKHPDDDRDEAIEGVVEELADMTEFDSPADFAADVAADNAAEGNAYAHAVKKAKMDGKKKGDKIDGPDGDEIVLASEEQKTPLGEFILSYFDYTTGQFPKGETAILTMVEKDYGEHFINPAKQFLEKINNRVSEVMGYRDDEVGESGLQRHIGIKKYGKKGFEELQKDWRPLYRIAWADFHRFMKGWSPGHWKLSDYSERVTREVIENLSTE